MTAPITALLDAATTGDPEAVDDLFRIVYDELRKIARSNRGRWVGNDTINTTVLIHEAFIKLAGKEAWHNRTHFYATAARAMRHILVSYAERQRAAKRGGEAARIPLEEALLASEEAAEEMIAVHEAMEVLEEQQPRAARVVECLFFGGMTIPEAAEALSVSPATVKREWSFARAWLYRRLGHEATPPSAGPAVTGDDE